MLNLIDAFLYPFTEHDPERNAEYCWIDAQLDYADGKITQEEFEAAKRTYDNRKC